MPCFSLLLFFIIYVYLFIQAKTDLTIPVGIFAALAFIAGFVALFEPETLGRPLPTTIEEILHWNLRVTKEEKQLFKQRKEEAKQQRKELKKIATGESGLDKEGYKVGASNKGAPPGYVAYQGKPVNTSSYMNQAYTADKDMTHM